MSDIFLSEWKIKINGQLAEESIFWKTEWSLFVLVCLEDLQKNVLL